MNHPQANQNQEPAPASSKALFDRLENLPAQVREDLIGRSIAVLYNAFAQDLSDAELTRCLEGCVAGHFLIPLMQQWRDRGGVIPPKELDRDDTRVLDQIGRYPDWAIRYGEAR